MDSLCGSGLQRVENIHGVITRTVSQKLWTIVVVRGSPDLESTAVLHLDVHTAPRQILRGILANLWHPEILSASPGADGFTMLCVDQAIGTTSTFRLCRAKRNWGDALMV